MSHDKVYRYDSPLLEPQTCHGILKSVLSTEDLWRVYGAENGCFDVD